MSESPGTASNAPKRAPPDAPKGWRRRLRLIVFGFAVFGISSLGALVIAEIAVRLVLPQQLIEIRPDVWEPVDGIGYLRRPDVNATINTGERTVTVRTDRDGNRVGAAGRTEAAKQVLLLGDSFMEALQVEHEQTTAHLVEQGLSQVLGAPVAVRNAGVSGWSPNHYLIRGREMLARDTFALVVVAVFVGNDAVTRRVDHIPPRPPTERRSFRFPRGLARSELVNALVAPVNDGLEVRSHLYILLKNSLSTVRMRLGLTADYLPQEYRRTEATAPRWQVAAELSRDLARAARDRGTPTLFVLIPERFQVYADEFDRYVQGFGIDPATLDVDQPSRLLREAFEKEGLSVVDALPTLRERAKTSPERLYGTVDQHLSPAGHMVLSEVTVAAARALVRR